MTPKEHKRVEDDGEWNENNSDMTVFRVKLTERGIFRNVEYIPYQMREFLTLEFFVALEAIVPSVPTFALRGAFDLV